MVKKKDNHFSAGKSRAKDSGRLKVSCLFMAILALALGGLLSLGVLCRLDAKRRDRPRSVFKSSRSTMGGTRSSTQDFRRLGSMAKHAT